jgi:hypothetical protein
MHDCSRILISLSDAAFPKLKDQCNQPHIQRQYFLFLLLPLCSMQVNGTLSPARNSSTQTYLLGSLFVYCNWIYAASLDLMAYILDNVVGYLETELVH